MTEPYALAMVPGRAVHTNVNTGQRTILDTLTAMSSAAFPIADDHLCVYLALTDGEDTVALRLSPALAPTGTHPAAEGGKLTSESWADRRWW